MFFKTTPKNLKKKFIVAFPVLSEQCPYLFTKNRTTNHNAVSDVLVRDFKIYTKIYEKLQRTLCSICRNTEFFLIVGKSKSEKNPYSGIFYAAKIIEITLFLQKLLTRKLPKNLNFAFEYCTDMIRKNEVFH